MTLELKENKFIAFRNTKLKDSYPDYRGEVMINGEIKEIVIWVKTDRKDEQFLSGSINPPRGKRLEQ